MILEVRGKRRQARESKAGEKSNLFDAWPRPGEGEYLHDKYATGEQNGESAKRGRGDATVVW